ncbi:HD domain-containing protein [Mycobacterium paragordonae]|uniref:HD domain-containing protein n=1 Tax=Mycobacterium paragordonae TaxID=1389713 RepID=A0A4R5WXA5_9MYCO|nr:HD domain-containing protein [Mycobacterium paragordonae]MDP7736105.1 HD domain-containing protein [Mycobacterium paragordonae]TDK99683.1 HD domain-containing protein [Mycobacterium paragordonae]TDL05503.1 HD domain-containing protein [Mycobacterium paragordonae]
MQTIPSLIDSQVACAAIELARSTESSAVFNHSVRSYLFGELLAAHEGLQPGSDFDSETLLLGCVLHDLGAGTAAAGKERFEVEGADLAAKLLTEQGCDRAVVDAVWEAIALHSSFGIAQRRGPICYLVNGGVGIDFGRNADFIDEQAAAAIHARYPRLSMAKSLMDAIAAQAQRSPEAALPYTMAGEVLRERLDSGITRLEQMAALGRWGA